jgi:hypothetical protein
VQLFEDPKNPLKVIAVRSDPGEDNKVIAGISIKMEYSLSHIQKGSWVTFWSDGTMYVNPVFKTVDSEVCLNQDLFSSLNEMAQQHFFPETPLDEPLAPRENPFAPGAVPTATVETSTTLQDQHETKKQGKVTVK